MADTAQTVISVAQLPPQVHGQGYGLVVRMVHILRAAAIIELVAPGDGLA